VARIYDYPLGGKDNFTVDREAAKQLQAVTPDIAGIVRDNRSFIGRVVHHVATEGGIRQFIDLGGGLPTQTNVHEMAQQVVPDARVIYVDIDPVVVWINERRPDPNFRSAGQPRSRRGGVGRRP
jgi:hypothetical protein